MEPGRISDAELVLIGYLWDEGAARASDLAKRAKKQVGWSRNTTYTLLTRMAEKGVITRADPGFICSPVVSREEVRCGETNTLIDKLYEGSRGLFLASFLKAERLSMEELEEIRRMIDEAGED